MTDKKPQSGNEKPKIVVDEDWKAQAEAEKQRLSETEQTAPASDATEQAAAGPRQLPPASFATLVSSIAAQIMFALGGLRDPRTGQSHVDLDLAKHQIDTLVVIEEKTRGNLSPDEKKILDNALYEVRMAYVRAAGGGIR